MFPNTTGTPEDAGPLCFQQSHYQKAPLQLAVPLYGYVMPVIIIITLVTNTFIVVVLSKKHLRTPSNLILLAMAVFEALTGLVSLPYMVYMYSLQGYRTEMTSGLPRFWCENGSLLMEQIPTILHTATVWLTVFLSVQRYIYVCHTDFRKYCTMSSTRRIIVAITLCAIIFESPKYFAKHSTSYVLENSTKNSTGYKRICKECFSAWVENVGTDTIFSTMFWTTAIFVNLVPCVLMMIFSGLLVRHIRKADVRKKTLRKNSKAEPRKISSFMSTYQSCTRMLIVVISVFLIVEIPAAVVYILHVLCATEILPSWMYPGLNHALTVRNALVMISYPFNFAVYCCMSNQFRLTVSQLFTHEQLFVEQQYPSVAKGPFSRQTRYSVILVSTRKMRTAAECETCM